jgi:hypothetical protein
LLDLRDELLGGWQARHVRVGLGIVAFGDALPSVECHLGEVRIGKYPEPVGGDGVRYQVGHGGRRHPFVDRALHVRFRHLGSRRPCGDLSQAR